MKTNGNQSKSNRIYDKSLKKWFEIPADNYREYDRERTAYRKRMQSHGRCCCPRNKWWLCDMFCENCEYHRTDNILSLDAPEGDGSVIMLDQQEAPDPRMENVIADRDLLQRLFTRLRELDPDADHIIALWMADDKISDRAIANALGRPQRTFADQMKRIRTELRKVRGY